MKKMGNRGFAVSGILYPILVLFLMLILGVLSIMSSRKVIFDKTKNDILDELNDPNTLNVPVITVVGKDITILNNTNVPNFNFDLKENVSAVTSEKTDFKKDEIMVTSEPAFNQGRTGVYKITYSVTDKYAKRASATRTVRVVDQQDNVNAWYFTYKGSYSELVIPLTGLYQIQAWGASGYGNNLGGKGAYTRGEIDLVAGTSLYAFVGEAGSRKTEIYHTSSSDFTVSFNGGGTFACQTTRYSGGGASDIRLTKPTTSDDDWSDPTSLVSRIMVAAGGGAAGQTSSDNNPTVQGGAGGGLTSKGGQGSSKGSGATQTTGASFGIGENVGSVSTTCGSSNAAPGGGGYYGGGASHYPGSSGAGGSSYISGFDGCNSVDDSGVHTASPNHPSGKIFKNAVMIPGDAVMPKQDGTGNMTGNSGNGYIKILQLKVVNE